VPIQHRTIPPLTPQHTTQFWAKIPVREVGECWEWHGFFNHKGYGAFWIPGRGPGQFMAHRVVWTLTRGSIPTGLCVCHNCDNPACCNPAHLFLGTPAQNAHDRDRKGRRRGEHSRHKLTTEQVLYIRKASAIGGIHNRVLARKYGVSVPTIHQVVRRLTWAHVP